MMLFGNAIKNFYGTVALTTPGGGAVSVNSAGTVTIAAPGTATVHALMVNGVTGSDALSIVGSASAGTSFGAIISGGTNATDAALRVFNQSTAVLFLSLGGDGHGSIGPSASLGLSWTAAGNETIAAPTSGVALAVTGAANQYSQQITAASTSGQSFGLLLSGGTTLADAALTVRNQSGAAVFLQISGDGHGNLGPSATLGLSWSTTGTTTISVPTAGHALVANGFAGSDAVLITGSASAGNSFGLLIGAGTTAADQGFRVLNQALTTAYLQVFGDGGVVLAAPAGGDQGLGTINTTGVFINAVDVRAAGSLTGTTLNATVVNSSLTSVGTLGSLAVTSSITLGGNPIYAGIPQNSQSANYTLVLADANKHIYHPSADTTARTWTIPANGSVAMPIGSAVTFDNDTSAGVITLAITTDTLVWLPTGATGSRSIAANGQATALKVTATRWHLTGVGIS